MPASFIAIDGELYARIPANELLAQQVDVPATMILPPAEGLTVGVAPATLTALRSPTSLPPVELVSEQLGSKITAASLPTGGSGILGWLSAIFSRIILPTALGDGGGIKTDPASAYERVINAPDLLQTYTYLSSGTSDERINTITYTSTSRGLTLRDTYTYGGSAGNYRVNTIARTVL